MIPYIETKHQKRAERKIYEDLVSRSVPGIFVYALIWLVIALPSLKYFDDSSGFLKGATALVLMAAIFRLAMVKIQGDLLKKHNKLIKWPMGAGVFVSSATWGFVSASIIYNNQHPEIIFALLICSAGICAGGGAVLAASRLYSNTLLYLSIGPAAAALLVTDIPFGSTIGHICIIFILSMQLVVRTLRQQYLHSLQLQFELQEQKESLSELSTLDPMTQLRNKRYFNDRLEEEFRRSLREKKLASLILLDLDYFKSINDSYGHLVGDECLKHTAEVIQKQFNRATDIVGRVGGEEFAILLPGASNNEAMEMAESLRVSIMNTPVESHGKRISLNVSMGVATVRPQVDGKAEDLFSRCDRALYDAKNKGRNQVVNSTIVDLPKKINWQGDKNNA